MSFSEVMCEITFEIYHEIHGEGKHSERTRKLRPKFYSEYRPVPRMMVMKRQAGGNRVPQTLRHWYS